MDNRKGEGAVFSRKGGAETQGKGCVLATKAVELEAQGKGGDLATKAVEAQGKGGVFARTSLRILASFTCDPASSSASSSVDAGAASTAATGKSQAAAISRGRERNLPGPTPPESM